MALHERPEAVPAGVGDHVCGHALAGVHGRTLDGPPDVRRQARRGGGAKAVPVLVEQDDSAPRAHHVALDEHGQRVEGGFERLATGDHLEHARVADEQRLHALALTDVADRHHDPCDRGVVQAVVGHHLDGDPRAVRVGEAQLEGKLHAGLGDRLDHRFHGQF